MVSGRESPTWKKKTPAGLGVLVQTDVSVCVL